MTLLTGILYQNTFKFPKVPRWTGKLNFKKSKNISIVSLVLLPLINPIYNYMKYNFQKEYYIAGILLYMTQYENIFK